jgi:hypothetical protein
MTRFAWLWVALGACGSSSSSSRDSVLELHASPTRAGAYVAPTFTHSAAATLHIDTTFTATYSGAAFAQALYYDTGGANDLVIAADENNEVSAFSPTGAKVWQVTLGTPQTMPNPTDGVTCGDINPLGITGTPVIDYGRKAIYLDAMIDIGGHAHHQVFALSLDDGSTLAGWPVDIGAAVTSPMAFMAAPQNQRGGLTIHDGHVYVPYGGHAGDCGNYHGWVVAVPQDNPQHPTAFATMVTQAGSWTPGGVTSDGSNVFAVFGNGAPTSTWGNSNMLARLGNGASFSGSATDYWVPTDWMALDSGDIDITGPAIPLDLAGSTPEHLLVSFGKDGNVYVTNRDDLGGIRAPVGQLHASNSEIINTSTLYQTAQGTYVAFRGAGAACPDGSATHNLVAVKITPGAPPKLTTAWCAGSGSVGSPIATTTDGKSEPIVWAIGAEGDERLHGYDGDTGAVVYAGGGSGDAMMSTSRFITPIVVKGRIFVAADAQLYAFTL